MCDDNCSNLKPDRMRCEICRTINLAKSMKEPSVDVSLKEKGCMPAMPCLRITELPLHPTCIKVCSKEQYKFHKGGKKLPPPPLPPIGHGKITYAVKAGLLVGSIYFTYSQGIWGDQQELSECVLRWQEYSRSFFTRRPPVYDKCGRIKYNEKGDSIVAPLYMIYKSTVTTVFTGMVKLPALIKCTWLEYLNAVRNKELIMAKERKSRRIKKKILEEERAAEKARNMI